MVLIFFVVLLQALKKLSTEESSQHKGESRIVFHLFVFPQLTFALPACCKTLHSADAE